MGGRVLFSKKACELVSHHLNHLWPAGHCRCPCRCGLGCWRWKDKEFEEATIGPCLWRFLVGRNASQNAASDGL